MGILLLVKLISFLYLYLALLPIVIILLVLGDDW